jgi:hypothetical protein
VVRSLMDSRTDKRSLNRREILHPQPLFPIFFAVAEFVSLIETAWTN